MCGAQGKPFPRHGIGSLTRGNLINNQYRQGHGWGDFSLGQIAWMRCYTTEGFWLNE